MLQNDRANSDDAFDIWFQELKSMLEPQQKDLPLLFQQNREGQTTNIAAFLFASSSPERQEAGVEFLRSIIKKQRRIVQQPLASVTNWTRWNDALKVSLWILAFSRWAEYYQCQRGIKEIELEQLTKDAQAVALIRPMLEWRSQNTGQSELAAFLEQAEELLISYEGYGK